MPHGLYLLTARLADSVPRERLAEFEANARCVLASKEIDDSAEFQREVRIRVERELDRGIGSCVFRRDEVAAVLQQVLENRNGVDYELITTTIMPNHLHVVFELGEKLTLSEVVEAWESVSARRINKILGKRGTLWQDDYYDTLMRHEAQLRTAVSYTVANPAKAGLKNWNWTRMYEEKYRRVLEG